MHDEWLKTEMDRALRCLLLTNGKICAEHEALDEDEIQDEKNIWKAIAYIHAVKHHMDRGGNDMHLLKMLEPLVKGLVSGGGRDKHPFDFLSVLLSHDLMQSKRESGEHTRSGAGGGEAQQTWRSPYPYERDGGQSTMDGRSRYEDGSRAGEADGRRGERDDRGDRDERRENDRRNGQENSGNMNRLSNGENGNGRMTSGGFSSSIKSS